MFCALDIVIGFDGNYSISESSESGVEVCLNYHNPSSVDEASESLRFEIQVTVDVWNGSACKLARVLLPGI